jgi:hypothetical protein
MSCACSGEVSRAMTPDFLRMSYSPPLMSVESARAAEEIVMMGLLSGQKKGRPEERPRLVGWVD